jgi:hypothetical protein
MPKTAPEVYAWLADQPRQVTLELPVPTPQNLPLFDPFYMYATTWHWQPITNGYSGHYALGYLELLELMRTFPDEASIQGLRKAGVQRVLVHKALYPKPEMYRELIARLDGHPMFHLTHQSFDHLDEVRVYAFLPNFGPR